MARESREREKWVVVLDHILMTFAVDNGSRESFARSSLRLLRRLLCERAQLCGCGAGGGAGPHHGESDGQSGVPGRAQSSRSGVRATATLRARCHREHPGRCGGGAGLDTSGRGCHRPGRSWRVVHDPRLDAWCGWPTRSPPALRRGSSDCSFAAPRGDAPLRYRDPLTRSSTGPPVNGARSQMQSSSYSALPNPRPNDDAACRARRTPLSRCPSGRSSTPGSSDRGGSSAVGSWLPTRRR